MPKTIFDDLSSQSSTTMDDTAPQRHGEGGSLPDSAWSESSPERLYDLFYPDGKGHWDGYLSREQYVALIKQKINEASSDDEPEDKPLTNMEAPVPQDHVAIDSNTKLKTNEAAKTAPEKQQLSGRQTSTSHGLEATLPAHGFLGLKPGFLADREAHRAVARAYDVRHENPGARNAPRGT